MADADRRSPIADYGLIGDTRTGGLISPDGAIDWLCVPFFDGDPLFGRLIGGAAAGTFRIAPSGPAGITARRYRPGTATIETTWESAGGRLTVVDSMVAEVAGRLLPTTVLVRRLEAHGGSVAATIEFDPRLGEHHHAPRSEHRGGVLVCRWQRIAVAMRVTPEAHIEPGRCTNVEVTPGQPVTLVLTVADREPLVYLDPEYAWHIVQSDERRWQQWSQDIPDDMPSRDAVQRSLLTLRLLTFSPSGAPVAAPTTSLPETLGGIRNWDYRFAWPRDASIGVGAFLGLGKDSEASRFLAWLVSATRLDRPRLPVLFNLHGRRPGAERIVEDWPGYANSRPVRVGNGAVNQRQFDGYGWVLDAAWLLTRSGRRLHAETWRAMRGLANEVAAHWHLPDAGIWEVRGDEAHHVHSKLMCWLALDRALRIAQARGDGGRHLRRWHEQRDALALDVKAHGYDEELGTYTRSYGSRDLDAALLVLPLIEIEPAESPRVAGTIEAIRRGLGAGGPLVYRYPPRTDGLPGTEGAFLACSFWLVQALAKIGRREEAAELFEQLLGRGGPLGLYAEELDPVTGMQLGNFPQALSHAALVQASLALRDAAG